MIKLTNEHLFRKGGDKNPPQISKYLRQTKVDKTIRRCRRWQVGDWGGGGKIFQLSVKGMSVQADGNSWKGRAKHITSLLYSTKHVRSPDWPGNHHLHTADKKREMPRNKMTLWLNLLIIMFVFFLLTNSHIPNWGLQKNADGHISNLDDLPREPPYQRWIEYFFG